MGYDDGDAQAGQVRIYYDGDVVISVHDLQYLECLGEIVKIENRGDTTAFTCPVCLRNMACGITGKYTRGDCTKWDVANPNHECYNILLGSDGVTYTPPNNDNSFYNFAMTWAKDTVDSTLENDYGFTVPDYLKTHEASSAIKPKSEGRIRGLEVDDATYYDGNCYDNMEEIKAVNETCRENIQVKYAECCAEIGICDTIQKGCVEDLCACTAPDTNNDFSEQDCLNSIVHESMNITCNLEWLYPTATPTGAPTPSPTGIVASLPFGDSTEEFVLYMAIFVVIFVLIAIGAFCYYKKKTGKGVHSFDEEPTETAEMAAPKPVNSKGYNKTETHAAI